MNRKVAELDELCRKVDTAILDAVSEQEHLLQLVREARSRGEKLRSALAVLDRNYQQLRSKVVAMDRKR